MRCRRKPGVDHLLQTLNLAVRNRAEAIPALTEKANDASRLDHFEVCVLVDTLVQEHITRKHRDPDHVAYSAAPAPDADLRQKDLQSFREQLVRDQLLRVTSGPDGVPLGGCQGSAPFGLARLSGLKPLKDF